MEIGWWDGIFLLIALENWSLGSPLVFPVSYFLFFLLLALGIFQKMRTFEYHNLFVSEEGNN